MGSVRELEIVSVCVTGDGGEGDAINGYVGRMVSIESKRLMSIAFQVGRKELRRQ